MNGRQVRGALSYCNPQVGSGLCPVVAGDSLQNPVLSPTAKQLQSSLKVMERTTVALGFSSGVLVFILAAGVDDLV